MNCRGGCCTARHAGGGGGGMYGMSKVDRIMQKYRPIAPKPVATGSGSGGSTQNNDGYVKCRRSKRKYVRVNGNKKKNGNSKSNRCENKKVSTTSSCPPPPCSGRDTVVTLSLLPETPDRKENSPVKSITDLLSSAPVKDHCNFTNRRTAPAPVWLSFDKNEQKIFYADAGGFDPVVVKHPPLSPPPRRLQPVSYVTVECMTVTDTWVDGDRLLCSDKARMMNMEMDTSPGFISDSQDRVVWTNKAFRQMAGGREEMSVVLMRKDNRTPSPVTYPTFTCKVRITSATHSHSANSSPVTCLTQTVPCDVWRMENGACAWRLDVKAALRLGR